MSFARALLGEYERALSLPDVARLISPELLRTFRSHLLADMEFVEVPVVEPICRDPDDDKVIATAVFGMVDYLVTEDHDLLAPTMVAALRTAGITIISMNDLIIRLGR